MARAPELVEPPSLAVGAVSRTLAEIARHHSDAWLLAFLDLVDKAREADPSEELVYVLRAALASAPPEDLGAAAEEARTFERQLRAELRAGASSVRAARSGPEVLVVTPKMVERRTCVAVFDCADTKPAMFDSHIRYRRFQPEGVPGTTVTLACPEDASNLMASHVVRDYVGAFGRPDLAVLCGMAMGTTTDVGNGDVVVGRLVFDVGPRRVTADKEKTQFEPYRVRERLRADLGEHRDAGADATVAALRAALPRMRASGLELPSDFDDEQWQPKVHTGVILSGDELVEDESGADRARAHDRAYALEMEGAGFAATCDHLGCDWIVVRGVADHGEPDRSKSWQAVATAAAASFVAAFLAESWEPAKTPSG